MEELRMKWCEELEQLLECPVCYDRLVGNIYFCEGGHNICSSCVRRLTACAVCHRPYTKTRNYLAEHLSEKMDTIKASLSDPNDPVNKIFKSKKISTGTQTDFDPVFTALSSSESSDQSSVIPWGVYPCWGSSDCTFKAPYRKLLSHIKSKHSDAFLSLLFPYCATVIAHTTFNISRGLSLIFRMKDVGLLNLRIDTDENGDLRGHVLMYASGSIARQYSYELELKLGGSETFNFGQVCGCRVPLEVLRRKGFIMSQSEFAEKVSEEDTWVNVSLSIDKEEIIVA